MCGIAGIVASKPFAHNIVGTMTNFIRHRGPDDEGFVLFGNEKSTPIVCGGSDTPHQVWQANLPYSPKTTLAAQSHGPVRIALGHRRLSIIDLSPLGHQPMSYANSRYWIVYNGEVYNHVELRSELEAIGYHFISHSDTEVILAAYTEWGDDCLQRFNGMFALAIYDTQRKNIFLARDRFGVKPLYYWMSPAGFLAFASEIKQFTCLPGWQPQVNGQKAYDFLTAGLSDHTDETMFSGVYQLQPGHLLNIDCTEQTQLTGTTQRLPAKQWYTLAAQSFEGDYATACREFSERFQAAISLRLRADVPIGSCLSGGLDSSSIVCVINQLLKEHGANARQKTFSACANVAKYDERKWIDMVTEHTSVEAHYVYPELEGLFTSAAKITWHQDEPFGSTSIYAQWNVFRLAADNGVKVMLDGQGADEQLAGYHGFFGPHLASLFRHGRWLALLQEMFAMKRVHGYGFDRAGKYLLNYIVPETIKDPLRRRTGRQHNAPDWLNLDRLGALPVNPMVSNGAYTAQNIKDLSISQLVSSNLQMLLHWEDRDSMAHSIESRVPFLDYRLVEFVLGLPDEFKLHGGVTKRVLRDSMRSVLPEGVRMRMDKLGFVTPEEVWLKERATGQFRAALNESIDISHGILNADATRCLFEKTLQGDVPFSFLQWRLINFGHWLKAFQLQV